MTSLKSSANKSAEKYDFRYSLKTLAFPAVVSFILAAVVFLLRPIMAMTGYVQRINGKIDVKETISAIRQNYASILTFQQWNGFIILSIFVICVGILFAFFAFLFLMRKNRINLFLSSPVGRAAMFKNRTLAAIALMSVTSLIPIAIDVIINIYVFGKAGYFIWHGILLFGEYLAYMLAGFSIMTISMIACNTIIESLFFGAGLIWMPTIAVTAIDLVSRVYLRGYAISNLFAGNADGTGLLSKYSIVNPIIFGKALGNYRTCYNMFAFVFRGSGLTSETGGDYIAPSYLAMGQGYKWAQMNIIAPFLIWLAISALFIYAGKRLFLMRKAENAGAHATAHIPTAIFSIELSAFAGAGLISIISQSYKTNKFGASPLLCGIAGMLLVYYITICICKRKIKLPKKVHITALSEAAAGAAIVLVLITGFFGYSTRVPDVKDVKYATIRGGFIDVTGNEGRNDYADSFISSGSLFESYRELSLGVFSSEEDISKLIDLNKAVSKKTDDMTGSCIRIAYKLKDGSTFERYFSTTDYEASYNVLSLTDSDAYHDELEFLLSSKRAGENKSDMQRIITTEGEWSDMNYSDILGLFDYSDEGTIKKLLHSCSAKLISNDLATEGEIKNTPELKDALLADMLSKDYTQRFRSSAKPLGEIVFYDENAPQTESEGYYYTDYISETIKYYIFDDMENTVAYLKSTGEYSIIENEKDYDFTSVTLVKCSDYRNSVSDIYEKSDADTAYFFRSFFDEVPPYADEDDVEYENVKTFINRVAAEKVQTIENKEEINKLYSASRSFAYTNYEDYIAVFSLADKRDIVSIIYSEDVK